MYVIKPVGAQVAQVDTFVKFLGQRHGFFALNPSFRAESCCKRLVMNGGVGFRERSFVRLIGSSIAPLSGRSGAHRRLVDFRSSGFLAL